MAQAKNATRETDDESKPQQPEPKPEPRSRAPGMPAGDGPVEFRLRKKIALPDAGPVVKENWVGRVCGRSVRVYRGAPEHTIPDAVRAELVKAGVPIGPITWEELGVRPPAPTTAFVNLTQQMRQQGGAFS